MKFLNRKTEKAIKAAVGITVNMAKDAVNKMADSMKDNPMIDRLEVAIAEELMTDDRVKFIVMSLQQKYEIKEELLVGPFLNDKTYTVKEYVMTVNGNIVARADDYQKLLNKLTALVLTEDEKEMKEFCGLVEVALKS